MHAGINFPGSWNDSKVAAASGLYYPKPADHMKTSGFAVLTDSVFPKCASVLSGKIVRAQQVSVALK